MMKSNSRPGSLLFLSVDAWLCLLAESTFNSEADKMDIWWTASSRRLASPPTTSAVPVAEVAEALNGFGIKITENANSDLGVALELENLNGADLVVVLQKADTDKLKQAFTSWSGAIENWCVPIDDYPVNSIRDNIAKLLVKLILKGGKRPPTLDQTNKRATPAGAAPDQTKKQPSVKGAAVRVSLESKGRGGKKVTVISGLPLSEIALNELSTELKQSCGSGGTVKDGCIEIQGDKRNQVMTELQRRNYRPKKSGG